MAHGTLAIALLVLVCTACCAEAGSTKNSAKKINVNANTNVDITQAGNIISIDISKVKKGSTIAIDISSEDVTNTATTTVKTNNDITVKGRRLMGPSRAAANRWARNISIDTSNNVSVTQTGNIITLDISNVNRDAVIYVNIVAGGVTNTANVGVNSLNNVKVGGRRL